MTPQELLAPAIPAMTSAFLATGVGALGAAIVGILWLQGRKIPGALGALPVAIPIAVLGGLAATGTGIEAVGTRLLLPLASGVPFALLVMFGAVAGLAKPPRVAWRVGLGLAPVLACAAVTIASGVVLEDEFFAGVRAVAYGVAGLLCLPSLAAPATDDRNGGEVASAVGAAYALVVGGSEAGARALAELVLLLTLSRSDVPLRSAIAAQGITDVIDPFTPWVVGAIACAAGLSAVGATAAGRDPVRLASVGSAGVVGLAAVGLWWLGAPDAAALTSAVP